MNTSTTVINTSTAFEPIKSDSLLSVVKFKVAKTD